MDVRLVIGTRPEAIKLAPLAHALLERGILPSLIFTGQHPGLIPEDFGLRSYPFERLDCPGERDPHRHVRNVTAALLPRLQGAPDLIVVQGDTSSAMGAALASATAGIACAHVEAGLRTHDTALPWPEEEYRTAIDATAGLLFAPTQVSAANLKAEGVQGAIFVTGNTAIDALLAQIEHLPPPSRPEQGKPAILVTCHRRESWGEGLQSIGAAVAELAKDADIRFILHPNPHVAGEMCRLLDGATGVSLLEPCGHRDLLGRIRGSDLVLSDSGGIQEEAPALGVPLLVLRDKTERPEGIAAGCMRLVGTSNKRIVREVRELLRDPKTLARMRRPSFPYGDGQSAPRIAAIIERWLKDRTAGTNPRRTAFARPLS